MRRERPGPDFLCIGMQKAGTKWLYQSLNGCPGFWMPPIKEMHFFDRGFLESDLRIEVDRANLKHCQDILSESLGGSLPATSLRTRSRDRMRDRAFAEQWVYMAENGYRVEDYEILFRSKESSLSGDITPAYSAISAQEVLNVKYAFPDLKVILLVRDPVERAWSSFNMHIRERLLPKDWYRRRDVLDLMQQHSTLEELTHFMNINETRQRSFPSVSYGRWVTVFGECQVHVTFFSDIVSRPAGVIEDVCAFLGVALASPPVPACNEKEKLPRTVMGGSHTSFLADYFRDEYRAMAALFPSGTKESVG